MVQFLLEAQALITFIPADAFSGKLEVTSTSASTATVSAVATVAGLVLGSTNTVTATFTSTSVANVEGTVTEVDKTNSIVKIEGVPYSLTGATFLNNGAVVPTLAAFYNHLTVGKSVTVTKDADGKLVFNVTGVAAGTGNAFVTAVNAALSSGSITALHNALLANESYKALPAAQQATVRTAIDGGAGLDGEYVSLAELEADLNPALVAAYRVLFTDVKNAAATGGTDAIKLANTVTALEVLPNSAATVSALKGITNAATLTAVLSDINGLTVTNYDTTAKFLTAINDSIANRKAAEAGNAINAALQSIVTELTAGSLNYTDVITALENNAATLTLSLTAFNGLTSSEKNAVIDELKAKHTANAFTPSTFKTVFNKAVVDVKDVTAPKITASKYDAAKGELTLTFSEVVDSTLTAGDINFNDIDNLPGSVAFTATAVDGTNTLVLTLTNPPAAFVVGAKITGITLTTGTVTDTAIPTNNSLVVDYIISPIDVK